MRYDPLQMLSLANAQLLQQAGTAAQDLAGIGAMFFFHTLLMHDHMLPGRRQRGCCNLRVQGSKAPGEQARSGGGGPCGEGGEQDEPGDGG